MAVFSIHNAVGLENYTESYYLILYKNFQMLYPVLNTSKLSLMT